MTPEGSNQMSSSMYRSLTTESASTSHPYVIGVDPGLKGAIAVIDRKTLELMCLLDMPTTKVRSTRHKSGYKLMVNGLYIGQSLHKYARKACMGVVERVGSRPGQGLESTFRFGHATGLVTGVLNGLAVPTVNVDAAAWKAYLGLSRNKQKSLDLAKELWPNEADLFKRKMDDGRAEACLLAYYAIKVSFKVNDPED